MAKKALAPSSPVTSRDPKGRKFISVVETAYNKAGLTGEEAQRVNEASGLADLVSSFIVGNRQPNQFADEEVQSNYVYPEGYKVKEIAEQLATLRQLFPELEGTTFDESIADRPLPQGAEGWFAIPRWEKLGSTYNNAVDKVLAKIGSERTFHNYREGKTGLSSTHFLDTLSESLQINVF